MNKEIIEKVLKVLENTNKEVNEMWNKKTESHAHIVGFFEGTNKALISFLREELEKQN
jgi:hypothetical protein